jgi:hypothetical protein
MHAALSDVEVLLKKLLIIAAFLMSLAVGCVWLAATPSYHEFFETKGDIGFLPEHLDPIVIPPVGTEIWVCEQKCGFSVFTRGKEHFFRGEVPVLAGGGILSEEVFDLLQEEIRIWAQAEESFTFAENILSEHFFVWDRYTSQTYVTKLCTPSVLSLMDVHHIYHDPGRAGMRVKGRNFILQGTTIVEIAIEDLFEESQNREWLSILAKEVEEIHGGFPEWFLLLEELDQFLVTRGGLQILFQPYLVGGGYTSYFTINVPWETMAPFLKPDAPVTRWYEEQLQKQ